MALLCVALLSITSAGEISNLCGKYQIRDLKMDQRCLKTSSQMVKENPKLDKAVMGYLCCLGYDCFSNAYNNNNLIDYLKYANLTYVSDVAVTVSLYKHSADKYREISKFAEHLDKCGRQVLNPRALPGCPRSTPPSFKKLTMDDFNSFKQNNKCNPLNDGYSRYSNRQF